MRKIQKTTFNIKKYTTGYIQSILYVLSIALSTVWIDDLSDHFSTTLLLFGSITTALLCFNILTIRNFLRNHKTIFKSPTLWLSMTLIVLLNWSSYYYAATHASATVCLTEIFLAQAIIATIHNKQWIVSSLASIVLVVAFLLSPQSTLPSFAAAILCGFSYYIYFFFSDRYMHKYKIGAIDILSIRLYPLFLMSIILMLINRNNPIVLHQQLNAGSVLVILWFLFFLGLANAVIPSLFAQTSVHNIGAKKFSWMVSTTPLFTYFLQGLLLGEWSIPILIVCLLATVILNIGSVSKLLI